MKNKQITVQPTSPIAILPTVPTFKSQTEEEPEKNMKRVKKCHLATFRSKKIVMPGQTMEHKVPHSEGSVVAVEP